MYSIFVIKLIKYNINNNIMQQHNNPLTKSQIQFPFQTKISQKIELWVRCKVKWIKIKNKLPTSPTSQQQFLGFLLLQDKFVRIMDQEKSITIFQFVLDTNVSISRVRRKSQEKIKGSQIKVIQGMRVFLESQNCQFNIQRAENSNLGEFYEKLILYPIFQYGEVEEWYKKKKIGHQETHFHYYLGVDNQTKQSMLVKGFSSEYLEMNQEVKESFLREFSVLKNISHSNIIKLHKAFKSSNSNYLVFQNPDFTLKQYVYEYGFPSNDRLAQIIRNTLQAIILLNQNGISHNNVNPSSVVLMANEQNDQVTAKLSCFEKCHFYQAEKGKDYAGPVNPNLKSDIRSVGILLVYVDMLSKNKEIFNSQKWDQMIKNPEIVLHEISIENANLKDFVVTLLSNNEKGYNSVQQLVQHPFLIKK